MNAWNNKDMVKGFTLWFTGLPGAGKSTLAQSVAEELRKRNLTKFEILDGDFIRMTLCKELGYSREDRETNIQRIAFVCQLLTRNDVIAIAAVISPYRDSRDKARKEIERFVEVFVKCPLDVLIQRDPKGLYQKAREGKIHNLTGISDPYEEPHNPEIVVYTDRETVKESTERIVQALEQMGYV